MRKVSLKGKLLCHSDSEAQLVRKLLTEHIRLTLAEPGCLSFEVHPTDDPWVWIVAEEFSDPSTFTAHQQRASASDWGQKTSQIQREYRVTGL